MRLAGKTAVITGGAGIIGMATARRFIAEGARVALVDRDAVELANAAGSLEKDKALSFVADVTQSADCARYARETQAALGPIDIFFNNAGIEGVTAPLTEFPEDVFEQVYAVNVRGVFLGLKYMIPVMRDGGSIVITSSIAGLRGGPNFSAYVMSKHAVVGLMRGAAQECAPRRIRVNTIHPGFVESRMMQRIAAQRVGNRKVEELEAEYRARVPFARYVKPEEIAAGVTYLASDDAAMVTGSQHLIDGGAMVA